MILLYFIFGVLITILFCGSCYVLLKENIIEAGYGSGKRARKARKNLKKQPIPERIFLSKLSTDAFQKKGGVTLYRILVYLNIIVFIMAIIANLSGLILLKKNLILYGGLYFPFFWLGLMVTITFIPDIIYLPSQRKRYDDPIAITLMIIIFGCMILGWILSGLL